MLDKLAKRMLQPVNTSVTSIMGAFNALLGFWLLLPFSSLSGRLAYGDVIELALGLITFIMGLCILVSSVREKLRILSIASLAGSIFWIAATGLSLYINWKSSGWIFTIMIASYHGFVGLNIRVNIKNLPNKN